MNKLREQIEDILNDSYEDMVYDDGTSGDEFSIFRATKKLENFFNQYARDKAMEVLNSFVSYLKEENDDYDLFTAHNLDLDLKYFIRIQGDK